MKKFKVIEESRFLDKNSMGNLVGGTCIGAIYTICKPAVAGGFSVDPTCGIRPQYGTCSIGWIYEGTELCLKAHATYCGSERDYFGEIPIPLP